MGIALSLLWAFGACQDGADSREEGTRRLPPMTAASDAFWFALGDGKIAKKRSQEAPEIAALEYVAEHLQQRGLPVQLSATAEVAKVHDIGRGGSVVQLRQMVDGIEVYGQRMSLLLGPDHDLVAIAGGLNPAARPGIASPTRFSLGTDRALAKATEDATGAQLGTYTTQSAVKPVLYPTVKQLVPAYAVEVELSQFGDASSEAWAYVVAADDGRILERHSLTQSEAFKYLVWADAEAPFRPLDGPQGDLTPHPTGNVADEIVVEAKGRRRLIEMEGFNTAPSGGSDPWLPDGMDITRGNNIRAYADHFAPSGFSEGDTYGKLDAEGKFSWPWAATASPVGRVSQIMTSIVQIFYTTNWLHDWYYDSGFTETAGNAQFDNYGRGGEEGDPLLAEGQDTKGEEARNNANMSTPSDGLSPRMQMYLWDGDTIAIGEDKLEITQPASLAGEYPVVGSSFGIDAEVGTAGNLVLGDDGSGGMGMASDGCEALQSAVSGKIAVVDRGNCPFVQKADNAATAGAKGLIVLNNTPASPDALPPLGGSNAEIAIPVVGASFGFGEKLKAALGGGTVAADINRAGRKRGPDRDGTIDNAIVAHEWGHYIHHRLTLCGNSQCGAMSEGWGDFIALHLHVRKGDNFHGTYAKAAWSTGDAYFGIRRVPYSVDFTKNALTFKHIQDSVELPDKAPMRDFGSHAEVHNAGEVWTTMLFEAYIALIDEAPRLSFEEAQRRMSDYIVTGMMLAPVNPTYTEQRDGILAAAAARDQKDLEVIARAFARRGAGTGAQSPPRNSDDLEGVVESFEIAGDLQITEAELEMDQDCDADGNLDADETGLLRFTVVNAGPIELGATTLAIESIPGVSFPDGNQITVSKIPPLSSAKAEIAIALDSDVSGDRWIELSMTASNPESFHPTVTFALAKRVNYDDATESSTVDDVESNLTAWKATTDLGDELGWHRVKEEEGTNMVWHAPDPSAPGEQTLESPLLGPGAEPFVVEFEHRYKFETSASEEEGIVHYDGAVIEISTDGGETWEDASKYAEVAYNGVLIGETDNPLAAREAFVDESPDWPEMSSVSIDFGTQFAGKVVAIRFRVGSDQAVGAPGWELDNISVSGTTNQPFSMVVSDVGACGDAADDAGGCGCRTGGASGGSVLLLLGAALLFVRRRRR